ncbi:MAG: hypothetical protein QXY85_01490 [Candidatus Nitrosocaldus sp.]
MITNNKIVLMSIPLAILVIALTYMTISGTTPRNDDGTLADNSMDDWRSLEYWRKTHSKDAINNRMGEGEPFPFDYTTRVANHIILGKVKDFGGISERLTPNLITSLNIVTVEVERDLTGYYNEKEITFRTWPTELHGLAPGDRIIIFIAREEKGELDPFQGDYYLLMGSVGIYKIVDGKAYGYYHDGIELEELIRFIEQARSERIKEITMKAEYIVLGKITKIEPILLYPADEPIDEKHIISSNITMEVEEELTGKYKEKEIVFFGIRDDISCKVGDRCLVFLKYGSIEYHKPMINKDKIAPYYYIHTCWYTDGAYKVIDGKAYGREFRYGINVDELVMRIKEYKGIGG